VNRTKAAGGPGAGKSKFVEVQFAKLHSAGLTDASRHLGIFGRHTRREKPAGGGGQNAGRVDVILQSDREAMQRPTCDAPIGIAIAGTGLLERRVGSDGDERV
jgi:hypothetical protein